MAPQTTAEMWWAQGFAKEEDASLKKLVAEYAARPIMTGGKAVIGGHHLQEGGKKAGLPREVFDHPLRSLVSLRPLMITNMRSAQLRRRASI
jgi:hypothetical protein